MYFYASLPFPSPPSLPCSSPRVSIGTIMMMLPHVLFSALAILPWFVAAQDGGINGPTSSSDAAGYNCDASKCQLPNCNCASTSPPGGLQPVSFHNTDTKIIKRRSSLILLVISYYPVRGSSIHCVHGGRCRSILYHRLYQPIPRTAQESEWLPY